MEKPILHFDIQFEHNGKQLLVGIREYDDDEVNMVLGEVINATTFDQVWSSGYDRKHITSEQQFAEEIFTPWCNTWIVDKYGPFPDGPPTDLEWWELLGKHTKENMVWDSAVGFSYSP